MTEQDWMAVINTNLNSVFNLTRQVIDGMSIAAGAASSTSRQNAMKGIPARPTTPPPRPAAGFKRWRRRSAKGVTVNTVAATSKPRW